MLAASGCHKDSFNFDEFTRPTTTNSDDGTPPTPNIRISSTDRTAQEGSGQIVLMINSDDDAPAGGLAVMITIAGAMDGDFTANAPCTANLVCTVRILEGNRVGNLVLMPTSDAAMENSEEWTASLVDGGSNYNFAANNNVAFDITDPPTPGPMMPLPEVDIIATSDSVVEGNPVVLVITSDLAAPSTGLPVDINIGVAMNGEFTFTATGPVTCTNLLVCTVTIPSGMLMVRLTLTPLSDFSTEPGERWTATLEDGSDYNLAAGGNDNVGFDIDDLIAAIGIATSDMPIEGGAGVTLTITSSDPVPATLTDGLNVTVDISGNGLMTGEFTTNADCTGLQCVVRIPPGMRSVELIITPLDDDAPEGGSEDWTATIAPDTDNNIFTVDSSTDNAVFAVANMLPPVVDSTDLDDLNAYNTPIPLAVSEIRAGVESTSVGPIVGLQYNDADNNPRVLVERLDFANLGIWINGDITDADFDFAPLNVNVVTPPTTSSALPTAIYALEGEMTYNGNRFYPDGELRADFANAEVSGGILLDGAEAADDFGGTTLADGTPIADDDDLILGFGDILNAADSGVISDDAFSGNLYIVVAGGFFASLLGRPAGDYSGRFNDNTNSYDAATAAPTEISGIFGGITDANGNALNGGFLGQCSADCRLPIIGISSSADTIQEGGQVVLLITSSIAAPTGGLTVTINIGVADATEFTSGTPPQCNGLVCEVVIAATEMSAELTLTALSGDEAENVEMWTATIEPDTAIFNVDSANDDATFSIADDTFSLAVNGRTLAELNALITPTTLAADAIRNLQSDAVRGVAITASRYGDAAAPDVFVQMLEFAALGIWVNGNTPEIGMVDHDFDYAFLGDNVVPTLPDSGSVNYSIEGDATYKGVNFFPDGLMTANFGTGNVFIGITASGSSAVNRADDFGDANAMVPDGMGGMRTADFTDRLTFDFSGTIVGNEFQGTPVTTDAGGFFSDLDTFTSGSISGRFYDSATYNPAATLPLELVGVMEIIDAQGNLNMGFLGRRP